MSTTVSSLTNPVTNTVVTLVPAFQYNNAVAFTAFQGHFNTWCQAQYNLYQADPNTLNCKLVNWPDSDVILPGQSPTTVAPTPTAAP